MSSTNPMAATTPTNLATIVRKGERGGEQRGVWGKESNRDQGGVQNPARSRETHTRPRRFPSFLRHRRRDGMETTCRLVSPSRGIEDEAVWSPHAASFPLLPAALKARRCGVYTLPRFHSFLGYRRRGGMEPTRRLVSALSRGIEDEAA